MYVILRNVLSFILYCDLQTVQSKLVVFGLNRLIFVWLWQKQFGLFPSHVNPFLEPTSTNQ